MQIFRLYAKVVSMIEWNKQTSLVEVILDENSRPQPLRISDIALKVASDFQTYVESKAFGGSSLKQYVGPTGYVYGKEDGELSEESLKGDTKFRFKTPPRGVEDRYKTIWDMDWCANEDGPGIRQVCKVAGILREEDKGDSILQILSIPKRVEYEWF